MTNQVGNWENSGSPVYWDWGEHRKGWTTVVLYAYGDESSDQKQKRVFAVAGLVGSEEDWRDLEAAWFDRTKGRVFHAAECDSDLGEFASTSHKENKKLYADLARLLAGTRILGFGKALDMAEFRDLFPDALDDQAYYHCFRGVVDDIARVGYHSIPQEPVKFTFDQNSAREVTATYLYDYMRQMNDWPLHGYLANELSFASRENPRIQVADLFAREVMKHRDNQIGPKVRLARGALETLAVTKRFVFEFYTRETLVSLKEFIESIPFPTEPDYQEWLRERRLGDNLVSRMKYLKVADDLEDKGKGDL